MLTRPLDVASKLRSEPRSMDWLFFVNVGLIAAFFGFFASRFVVSPGLAVDFELPHAPGTVASARPTTHVITVTNSGQIIATDGVHEIDELQGWLQTQAKTVKDPTLLVRASGRVPMAVVTQIIGMARAAGFGVEVASEDLVPPNPAKPQ
jgi:biopolymer transport protein ExbD